MSLPLRRTLFILWRNSGESMAVLTSSVAFPEASDLKEKVTLEKTSATLEPWLRMDLIPSEIMLLPFSSTTLNYLKVDMA